MSDNHSCDEFENLVKTHLANASNWVDFYDNLGGNSKDLLTKQTKMYAYGVHDGLEKLLNAVKKIKSKNKSAKKSIKKTSKKPIKKPRVSLKTPKIDIVTLIENGYIFRKVGYRAYKGKNINNCWSHEPGFFLVEETTILKVWRLAEKHYLAHKRK